MAYSQEQWERTKALFESGKYSLTDISEKTGINKSQISRKSKMQQWESGRNADYIEAREIIATKKATETQQTLQILDDIADETIRHKKLVYGVTESALNQLRKISDDGVKEVLVKTKLGNDIIVEKETINLTPSDYESIINATDKASLTLGVNQRHSNQQINVNTQNNNTVQNNELNQEIVTKTLENFEDEY